MKLIEGGVCAAKGFRANGIHCGIRRNPTKRDLALIYSEVPASAAAVYTTNLVKGAPLTVTKKHLANGTAQAVICNSGKANTCNANGVEIAEQVCRLAADAMQISADDVLVASTGVIGQPLDVTPIAEGMPSLVAGLARDGSDRAAHGIMTMDTVKKEVAVEFALNGKTCRIGGIGKGSGMIHPNMATMLVFITTDAAISPEMLQKALSSDVANTFNMISVDGDTSTNDMVAVLANGMAGNDTITTEGEDFSAFVQALNTVTIHLCRCIAGDGEGATKLLECKVTGAADLETAKTVAKSVICSSLIKAAMFGADANWGRVLCAIGYSGAQVDVDKIDVAFRSKAGEIAVCKNGAGVDFSEELAKKILLEKEIDILVELNSGDAASSAWGCDLTYDFVRINGDYRMEQGMTNARRAEVLTEALPYIRRYTGKTVVIKYGGNAMVNETLKAQVMEDIALLWLIGVKVVLVHGGGPEINDLMKQLGKVPQFVDGLRVTDKETIDIVQMVLAGKVNKSLANLLQTYGARAVGMSGVDGRLIECKLKDSRLGYVGEIVKINIDPVNVLLAKDYIPIISTVGCDKQGNTYNINGDTAAAHLAGALNAERLIMMTDIEGLLEDKNNPSTLISRITVSQVRELQKKGIISGGMIPKVECCVEAIQAGVENVVIMDGRVPHSILMELLTDEGAGTLVTGD